jgi:hypothetical protein
LFYIQEKQTRRVCFFHYASVVSSVGASSERGGTMGSCLFLSS